MGRSCGGRTTKIHAITDEKCRLYGFALSAGNVHDLKPAPQLIRAFPKLRTLLADRAYNASYIDAHCAIRAIEVVIPPLVSRTKCNWVERFGKDLVRCFVSKSLSGAIIEKSLDFSKFRITDG